jgi:hypothetical protein
MQLIHSGHCSLAQISQFKVFSFPIHILKYVEVMS